MKFRTEIKIPKATQQLDYSKSILSLGSCFATSIGGKLVESKFNACVNPTGVLFNPFSIGLTLDRFASQQGVAVEDLRQGAQGWYHLDFHSSLSDVDASVAADNINRAVKRGGEALEKSDVVIITLGTVWVYEHLESGAVVANCHKEPSRNFNRQALSVDEVACELSRWVERYADKQFIFSVSPIRHLSDGMAENSLSKATLRVAISQVVERYSNASYFPSYEILLDDLRDYRFYSDDMVHPSQQAVEYIWSKFCDSMICDSSLLVMEKVAQIVRAAAHRPFNAQSSSHKDFCLKQLEAIKSLADVDLSKESRYFMDQLQNIL